MASAATATRRISESESVEGPPFEFKTVNPDAELRPELKEKIEKWILSFYHLDPRYKILTFFNLVASEGADNVTDDSVDEQGSFAFTGSNGNIASAKAGSPSNEKKEGAIQLPPSSAQPSPRTGGQAQRKSSTRETYRVNANLLSRQSARHIRPSTLSLLSSLFNATSILTVWRPCSNDAMRKMMEGTGVGKGLDIKGKSAKKGTLSAFVPFMQIFNNDHKNEIQPITEKAEMRIYYKSEELRDHVFGILQKFREDRLLKRKKKFAPKDTDDSAIFSPNDLVKVVEEPANENGNKSDDEEDKDVPNPHKDPSSPVYISESSKLKRIKKYVKTGYWGIECSQRLFWYATVQDADITRAGTGTETGRPSLPAFQDANHKTLKAAQAQLPKPTPMPVVLQTKTLEEVKTETKKEGEEKQESIEDEDSHPLEDTLDPRYLVMAYEEQGTIKPVVSDFDGFLLGWRREALWFGCNLPRDQESLMMWCVDKIEEILDDQVQNPTNSDTWTIRWLDVLKQAASEGLHVEMPEYGFGDPKSTSIMEHAANKLKSTGAVRHGSECFNYQFPQEIDEMFLLISDTLKPVPWKYVNVTDLQVILSKKIAEGFVFPLNPKWILCDPGWKKIYDEIIASDALYADLSKDVWFPHHSGIRERIEKIHKRHPNGFQRCTDPALINKKLSSGQSSRSNMSGRRNSATNILRETVDEGAELTGNAYADLAQLELDDFVGRSSVIGKRTKSISSEESMRITEVGNEDNSSSEFPGSGIWQQHPRRKFEKRPSTVSHKSDRSDASDKGPSSNRSIGLDPSIHSVTSSSSKARGLRNAGRMLSKAGKSTLNILGAKKIRSKPSSLGVCGEDDQDVTSHSNIGFDYNDSFNSPGKSKFSGKGSSLKKYRDISDKFPDLDEDPGAPSSLPHLNPPEKMATSKRMNKEPRRHFGKWNKIKENLNKNK